jgi:hypothetical protein
MNIPPIYLIAAMALSALIGFVLGVVCQSGNGPNEEDW